MLSGLTQIIKNIKGQTKYRIHNSAMQNKKSKVIISLRFVDPNLILVYKIGWRETL